MESHPLNPEIRNNPENFHPCIGHELKLSKVTQRKFHLVESLKILDWWRYSEVVGELVF